MNRYSVLVLAALVAPIAAEAAESGSIRGKVTDESNNPIAGVEVTLSGPGIAGEIKIATGSDGTFKFLTVPPGTHSLLFVAPGKGPVRADVTVRLDQTASVPVQMKAVSGEAVEEVLVEEQMPVIDTTRSSFSSELSDELLQNIPVGRSYQDAVNMIPGVYGRVDTSEGGPGDGNPSVRGEGQYGNNFLVDGVSTRDPATKTFGSNVNFDSIEDIQVYTDGAPAEFGQFAGMLVNVVTKDGGDEHEGSVGYWLSTDASAGQYDIIDYTENANVPTDKRDFLSHSLSLTAGGPIAEERLWYFGGFDLGDDTAVFEGGDPEAPFHARSGAALVKFTFFATPDITLRYMFNGELARTENYETSSAIRTEAQAERVSSSMSHLVTLGVRPDAVTEIELKGGYWQLGLDQVPSSGNEDLPNITNLDTGQLENNWTDYDLNRRRRIGGGLTITRLLNDVAGDHEFKAGSEYWVVSDSRQLVFTGPGEGTMYYSQESAGYPCTMPVDDPTVDASTTDCAGYVEYSDVGWLSHRGQLLSGFVQDDWQPVPTFTVNIGARFDREALFQNEEKPVSMDDITTPEVEEIPFRMMMPVPRLGVAWDVTGDGKTLATLNAGRYYDVTGNAIADWADTKSAYSYTQYGREDDADGTNDCMDLAPDGPYCTVWIQDPTGNPLIFDSTLKPAHLDKVTLGFSREVMPLFALGVRGIVSTTQGLPEDVDTDLSTWYIMNPTTKRRDYRGLELTAEKKFDERWQLLASWTLSESKGTTPGQFETASAGEWGSDGNQVGVYLDDVNAYYPDDVDDGSRENAGGLSRQEFFDYGYGWLLQGLNGLGTTTDDAGWYGYLPYHSFHSVKVNGSYTFPIGTTLGLVYEFDSGHAWQKRTFNDIYGDYMNFGEGRGTRFMPAVNYVDVRVAHAFELPGERSLELSADVFNLPDLQAPITYYENDNENFGLVMYRQQPRAVRAGMKVRY